MSITWHHGKVEKSWTTVSQVHLCISYNDISHVSIAYIIVHIYIENATFINIIACIMQSYIALDQKGISHQENNFAL
jgi:hypothetical protein